MPVAQLDSASDSDSEGRRFESCRAYHHGQPILMTLRQAVFLDTATLYLQRIMQLVAGGFFIFVECVSVDVQRCRDLRVPEET